VRDPLASTGPGRFRMSRPEIAEHRHPADAHKRGRNGGRGFESCTSRRQRARGVEHQRPADALERRARLTLFDEEHQRLLAVIKARTAAQGEPWLSCFEPADLKARIEELGFAQVWDLGPEEANDRYFAGRTDGLRVPPWVHLMSARVGSVR